MLSFSRHTRDLLVLASGELLEVEELKLGELSQEVHTALDKKATGAKIVNLESLTKRRKLVAYEAATE